MANFDTFANIKLDILDRAGEVTDGTSDYDTAAGRAIVRAFQQLSNRHPFLYLRSDPPGAVRTIAPLTTGTVNVENGNTAITFSSAPTPSVAKRKIKITAWDEFYRIATHTAGATAATLDSAFNGTTDTVAPYTVYQDEYDLATDLRHMVGMWTAENLTPIEQKSEEWLRENYPSVASAVWPPLFFARVGEQRIRFEGYPNVTRRIEYAYTTIPTDPTDTILVPRNWRYVLADGALYWLYMYKNDNRADAAGVLFLNGVDGMIEDDLRKRSEVARLKALLPGGKPDGV